MAVVGGGCRSLVVVLGVGGGWDARDDANVCSSGSGAWMAVAVVVGCSDCPILQKGRGSCSGIWSSGL